MTLPWGTELFPWKQKNFNSFSYRLIFVFFSDGHLQTNMNNSYGFKNKQDFFFLTMRNTTQSWNVIADQIAIANRSMNGNVL